MFTDWDMNILRINKPESKQKNTKRNMTVKICSVPQCKTFRKPGISLHQIPPGVLNDKRQLLRWKLALRMTKPFSKTFVICSQHFNKEKILRPIPRGQRSKAKLLASAFPTLCLPQRLIAKKLCSERIKARYRRLRERNAFRFRDCQSDNSLEKEEIEIEFVDIAYPANLSPESKSVGIQHSPQLFDKGTQVDEELRFNFLPLNLNTDEKLYTTTGIPTKKLLGKMVEYCQHIQSSEKPSLQEFRIILTMYRIKHGASNALTALLFNLPEKTARTYFTDCVQLLSKALRCSIYWQTKEENQASLPTCFASFPNTVTILGRTDIKVPARCESCPSCTCSQYKETRTIQLLVGTAPSGLINFISTAIAGGRTNNLSALLHKLKSGDAVVVYNGFTESNAFSEAGVEVIRPQIIHDRRGTSDVENNRFIAAARFHVRKRISQIKAFKAVSERVAHSNLPYLDDMITIVCAISNLSSPFPQVMTNILNT